MTDRVQYTSEAAHTIENGEEVERMKSRAVDADVEREAQKLSRPAVLPDCMMLDGAEPCKGYRRLQEVIEGQGLSMAAMSKELREARAEIARLRARLNLVERPSDEPDRDATPLRVPPEADAMASGAFHAATAAWCEAMAKESGNDIVEVLTRHMAEYGERCACEARAEYVDESRRLREACVAAARAEAIEEAKFAVKNVLAESATDQNVRWRA
jgi:hypothetical protein